MTVYTRLSILLLGICAIICCQSDNNKEVYADQSEAQYFEDYESPRFKWGLINTIGQEILEPKYDDLKDPIDLDHIPASLAGKWTYITHKGKPLVPHQFQSVETWSDGAGWGRNFQGSYHIITDKGISDTINASNVKPFSIGLAAVNNQETWMYIDQKGKEIIQGPYLRAGQFNAAKQAIVKSPQGYGVIDQTGKYIVDANYTKIKEDTDGYLVKGEDGYQYLDFKGKLRWVGQYKSASTFNDNYALVKDDGGYALIDNRGNKAKSLPYGYVVDGGEGFWKFKEGNKWGFLSNNGEVVYEPTYDNCYKFEEGFLVAAKGEKWGIVNTKFEVLMPFRFPLLWSFKNGYARIIDNGFIQAIDTRGNRLENIHQIELRDFHNGLARFQKYPTFDQ